VAITKEITRLEKSNVRMNVTVPNDVVRSEYEKMLKDYTRDLQLPGFRKGKVPSEVLERKFGESLRKEALGRIIEYSLKEIFEDDNLNRYEKPMAYSTPELEGEPNLDFEQDLQYSVTYDVFPEVKINQWKDISVEYPYAELDNEVINKELEEIRERNAIVMDRDDDAASQTGDVVTIDYEVYDDKDTAYQGVDLNRRNFTFTLGSNSSTLDIDNSITGLKKGESNVFYKKFDDDHENKDIAGRTCKIKITLNELKEKKLPDLDDELAQDVDEKYRTLEDLKNNIKNRLEKDLEIRLKSVKINELLKKIMETSPVVIPESLIEAELESRMRSLAQYYRMDSDMIKKVMASDPEFSVKQNERRETAIKSLHSRMIMETLMDEQNIQVTDEDMEKEYERIAKDVLSLNEKDPVDELTAENIKNKIDELKNDFKEEDVFYMKETIKEQRMRETLLAENKFIPGNKENYLAFMSENS